MKKKEYIKPESKIETIQIQILAASGDDQPPSTVNQTWSLGDYEGEELEPLP